jgi:hypothetical protein
MRWFPVRCKFFENTYEYNSKGQIRNKTGKIIKPISNGKSVRIYKSVNGVKYKKVFKLYDLINTDRYLDTTTKPIYSIPIVKPSNDSYAFKKVTDKRVRSCSLEDINTLNLT